MWGPGCVPSSGPRTQLDPDAVSLRLVCTFGGSFRNDCHLCPTQCLWLISLGCGLEIKKKFPSYSDMQPSLEPLSEGKHGPHSRTNRPSSRARADEAWGREGWGRWRRDPASHTSQGFSTPLFTGTSRETLNVHSQAAVQTHV